MSTRDLVDALVAGDSLAIETAFDDVMSDKVSAALGQYKIEVAANMFNPQQDVQVEDNVDNANE